MKCQILYNCNNGQVNIASDSAIINATQTIGINSEHLSQLINAVRIEMGGLSPPANKKSASDNLAIIEQELQAERPRKDFIRTAFSKLQELKGPTEFIAAVVTLMQFVQQFI